MRRHVDGADGGILQFAELELDPDLHAARIGNREVELTPDRISATSSS